MRRLMSQCRDSFPLIVYGHKTIRLNTRYYACINDALCKNPETGFQFSAYQPVTSGTVLVR